MGEKLRGLIIPGGLVHAHIHLDKCFLLEKTPVGDGSFSEALKKTSEAKAAFTKDDLIQRGEKLIKASLQHGVLSMRAFVEVDPTVGLICLEAGLILRERFKNHCTIQLCIFAQDPIFYPQDASKQARMSQLLEQACEMSPQDSVLGSTPYVEQDYNGQCRNIDYLFNLADTFDRSVDFHLDYNLDEDTKPLVWYVFEQAHKRQWKKGITIGHATRMSLFSESEWDRLAKLCHGLDVGFVALPHSDLYMQGRVTPYKSRSRATLPLLELQQRDVPCALAVNNVANLFTPQGDGDPLAMLPMIVGLWQSATEDSLRDILSMVSSSAAKAIGLNKEGVASSRSGEVTISSDQEVALDVDIGTADYTVLLDCDSIQQAVLSPPHGRLTIKNGKLVAWRKIDAGVAEGRKDGVESGHSA